MTAKEIGVPWTIDVEMDTLSGNTFPAPWTLPGTIFPSIDEQCDSHLLQATQVRIGYGRVPRVGSTNGPQLAAQILLPAHDDASATKEACMLAVQWKAGEGSSVPVLCGVFWPIWRELTDWAHAVYGTLNEDLAAAEILAWFSSQQNTAISRPSDEPTAQPGLNDGSTAAERILFEALAQEKSG